MKPKTIVGVALLLFAHFHSLATDFTQLLGGSQITVPLAVALDTNRNVYLTGYTYATDLASAGAFDTNFGGASEQAFVAEFDTNGALVFCSYLGGSDHSSVQSGQGIAVDVTGNILVAGYTSSTNFPTKAPLQATNGGGYDAFLAELAPGGASLVFSTYFGGSGLDAATSVALDTNNSPVVSGYTQSSNFPTANAMQPAYGGKGDAFVAKFSPAADALAYSTYLGGSDSEDSGAATLITYAPTALSYLGGALTVDFDGNAYVTGWTYSTNFPATNAFQPTNATSFLGEDPAAFVTKLDANGQLVYSTYFGGRYGDYGRAIAVDYFNNVYFGGNSVLGDLPLTNAAQPFFGGYGQTLGDGFVAALDPTGTNLLYCTYLGGSGDDVVFGLAVRWDGSVAVTGATASPNFPLMNADQSNGWNGLLASADGGQTWATANQGLTGAKILAVAVDPFNSATVYALTSSSLCKSANGGQSWVSINTAFPGFSSYSTEQMVALDPQNPGTIYYAPYLGLQKSADGGATWTSLTNGLPASSEILAVAIDPQNPQTLYAATYSAGVFKSVDGGTNWTAQNAGLPNLSPTAVRVDPMNSANVFLGLNNPFSASVFLSANGGTNWTVATGLPTYDSPVAEMAALRLPGTTNSAIYIILGDFFESATLYATTNGGASWWTPLEMLGGQMSSLAVDLTGATPPTLQITTSGGSNVLSWAASFGGFTLQSSPSLSPPQWQDIATPPVTNSGDNLVILPTAGAQEFFRLRGTNAPSSQPALYVGGDAAGLQGLSASPDNGRTWSDDGLDGDTVSALGLDTKNPNRIFAGLSSGYDGFIATLTPSGQLSYSSYLGGNGLDSCNAIALADEDVYVTGVTASSDFPGLGATPSVKPKDDPQKPPPQGVTTPEKKKDHPQPGGTVAKRTRKIDCPQRNQTITYTVPFDKFYVIGLPGDGNPLYDGAFPPGLGLQSNFFGSDEDQVRGTPTQRGQYTVTVTYKSICPYTITLVFNVQ